MAVSDSPLAWECPQWHPDWRDTRQKFEQLRAFALSLLSSLPGAKVEFEILEPGYMNVRVELAGGKIAEVYSVGKCGTRDERQLAIFVSPGTKVEEEMYADSVEIAVNRFTRVAVRKAKRAGRRTDRTSNVR